MRNGGISENVVLLHFISKRMKKILLLFGLLPLALFGQRITPEDYIETYKDIAMREMREHKIPASITLAQGLLESGAGNSALAREAKNHFGIKCHKGWEGDTYIMDDDAKNECFRKYNNAEESFVDHSLFLTTRSRYAALFDLDITDYEGWAKGLKAAGYATNPKYAQLLIDRINLYDLTKYDQIALGQRDDDNQLPDIAPEDELLELAYSPERRAVFELVDMTQEGRFIYENNKVRFVFAKEGETPDQLAKDFNIKFKRFCEYNLLNRPDEMVFHSGDVVYLGKLRNSNWKAKKHIVEEGETLRDIALRFAVKPDQILKKNSLEEGARISKGQELWLR